jgi:WD40 repeat protein
MPLSLLATLGTRIPCEGIRANAATGVIVAGHSMIQGNTWDGLLSAMTLQATPPDTCFVPRDAVNTPTGLCFVEWAGDMIVAGTDDGSVFSFTSDATVGTCLTFHQDSVVCGRAGPGWALTGSWDRLVAHWDIPGGKVKSSVAGPARVLAVESLDPFGDVFAAGAQDGLVRLYDLRQGPAERPLALPGLPAVTALRAVGPHGLVAGADSGQLFLVDLRALAVTATFKPHTSFINDTALLPGRADVLVTVSTDRSVKVVGLETGEVKAEYKTFSGPCQSVTATPQGHIIVASRDKTIKAFSLID